MYKNITVFLNDFNINIMFVKTMPWNFVFLLNKKFKVVFLLKYIIYTDIIQVKVMLYMVVFNNNRKLTEYFDDKKSLKHVLNLKKKTFSKVSFCNPDLPMNT